MYYTSLLILYYYLLPTTYYYYYYYHYYYYYYYYYLLPLLSYYYFYSSLLERLKTLKSALKLLNSRMTSEPQIQPAGALCAKQAQGSLVLQSPSLMHSKRTLKRTERFVLPTV